MKTHPRKPRRDKPNRGVRIDPLPEHMHDEFKRFCAQCTHYAQSNFGTWRMFAATEQAGIANAEAIYWRAVVKWMSTIEYYGTTNDATRRTPR